MARTNIKRKYADGTLMPQDKALLYTIAEYFNFKSDVALNGMIYFYDNKGNRINGMHAGQWLDIIKKAMLTEARGWGKSE